MENKEGIMNNLLCMACLSVGRNIREIADEQHKKFYLDALEEIPLSNMNIGPRVCWECDAMLRKVLSFKEQVKDCYRILLTYAESIHDNSLLAISRPPRLKVHNNDVVIITPCEDGLNVKLEDQEKQIISYQTDCLGKGPVEDIQTVMCDVKRDRRKKKNTLKTRRKSSRSKRILKKNVESTAGNENSQTDFIKVEVDLETRVKIGVDVKAEVDNDEDSFSNGGSIKSFDSDKDTLGDIDSKIQTFLEDIKNNKDKTTRVKKKKKDTDKGANGDIDNEIQTFLDDIKNGKDNSMKVKKRKSSEKKMSKHENILTVDLSYDEMQTERSALARRESYLQAQYKCASCLLVFNCATSLQTHQLKKHKVTGDYICSICQTVVTSVDAFTAHYKRHMKRYECAICHKRSTDIKSIQQHLHTRHQITLKKYKCKSCGKVSKSLDTHRYHCDMHKSRVQCPQCDKTFSHRAGLMNHRLAVHESQNQFPCTLCDKVFRWKTSLKRHLEKHNSEETNTISTNKAYCEACDIGFSSVCSLQRHLRNSLKHVTYDQLKFICDHCNQRYVDKTKLRDHIEEKHLYRTFQCQICHKTKVQLESHIRTHTGERPFMCEYCPATFSQQSNLYKHHRQVHLNMKSKRYPLCKKTKIDVNQATDPQPTFPIAIMQFVPENGFSF
ncbi:zinc finger protein 37 homolog isoform X3 [Pararge aegeria]|uniref:zinc finger protein 37 homolog isoform X3 n=1 Tax=Pararge aegeria TaxID=116150 RepID=UPI0019CF5578|nr:zinc finger protein 37 homolog isoform X3 [Pararge aegeria]